MRPTSLEDGQRRKLQLIIAFVILITLTSVALILWDSSDSGEKSDLYFSKIKLSDKRIEEGGKTDLLAQVSTAGYRTTRT